MVQKNELLFMCIFNYFKQLVCYVLYKAMFSMLAHCVRPIYTYFFSFFRSFLRCFFFLLLFGCCISISTCNSFAFWLELQCRNSTQTENRKWSWKKKIRTPTYMLTRYDRSQFLFQFQINSCACHVIDTNMFFRLFTAFSHVENWKFNNVRGIFDWPMSVI